MLLAANKTQLCFPDSPPISSPSGFDNIWSTPAHSPPSSGQACSDVDSLPSRQTNSVIDCSPTPRPRHIAIKKSQTAAPKHRRISLADLKRSPPSAQAFEPDFNIFLQPAELSIDPPIDHVVRDRSDTVFSDPSNGSIRFDQKTYKELVRSPCA